MFGVNRTLLISLIFTAIYAVHSAESNVEETRPNTCYESGTELVNEEEAFLYLSTLDGTFIGVNHNNGEIKWQFKEEAAVKVPVDSKNALSPIFLPDPRDGSLYLLNSENNAELKKLQFTIQQLVSSSPCRSSDGIFYTGKKIDNWFMVDWQTGWKEELLSVDNTEKVCPLLNRNSMFLGRTEYNLIIYDITRKEMKWNVTFYDYAAKIMPSEKIKNLEYIYFSGSSTGKFAVMKNLGGGSLMWEADFGSPVIGVYLREGDGLIAIPFTTMDDNSMPSQDLQFTKQIKLFSTLYIGAHTHGLYALPAYATSSTDLLLNGPSSEDAIPLPTRQESTALLGYHEIPQDGFERLQITGRTDAVIDMNDTGYGSNSSRKSLKNIAVQTEEVKPPTGGLKFDRYILYQLLRLGVDYVVSSHNVELKVFMATVLTMMVCMFIYFRAQVREFKQSSSSGFSVTGSSGTVTATAEELPDGSTRVGKIQFDTNAILGKGCEGTFVFKGKFDNRPVAVKRLLPECFTVADREVCLLRESDQHPNVIRYFCMEQDKQFRYIALELCSATLQEYTEQGKLCDLISPTEALAQATAGLEHLHALNIVHRDLKPHNVLLSVPSSASSERKVRTMISDFGLCKKLQTGKASFSRKSGITGTDGWIAPEMIHGRCRTTTAVDIFSMGCVFYYVLSKGKHPFGESLSRQANIMNGKFKLNEMVRDDYELWSHLIAKMVTIDPLERPPVSVIKMHPAFWSKDQSLSFLQDVSDRIEKEDITSKILIELETGNATVLNGDWRDMIEPEIAEDLRKYRSYRADSVRDLLRALRNKKHHYRELSDAVRHILGSIPDQFVTYWMDRFPRLLLHTWLAMQCISDEDLFHKYYCSAYTFPRIDDGAIPGWIQQCTNASPRWKLTSRSVSKFGSRYGGEKGSSPFFSLSNSDKPQVYMWRQRPKAISEVSEVIDGVDVISEKIEPPDVIEATTAAVDDNEDDVVEVEVAEPWIENQENAKPADEMNRIGEEATTNDDERCQKNTRHRRTRGRSKKKPVIVAVE